MAPGSEPRDVEVLIEGPFERAAVATRLDPAPRASGAELDLRIERRWQELRAQAQREGRELFDGALLRFVAARERRDAGGTRRLDLVVGPGGYREFAATNLDPTLLPADRGGRFPWASFGNALGTSAIVATADGALLLGRRSERVFNYPGWLHAFGGMLEPDDRSADRAGAAVDPFASVARELREELGVAPTELRALTLHAVIREPCLHQPALLFLAATSLARGEVEERWQAAESRAEHAALVAFPRQRAAIERQLATLPRVTPIARACLAFAALG